MAFERVIINVEGVTEKVSVEIRWAGGHKTCTNLIRPVAKLEQLSYYSDLAKLAADLKSKGMTLQQITDRLNKQGWHSPKLLGAFSKDMVNRLLTRTQIKVSDKKALATDISRMENEFTFCELSQKINMPEQTLYRWMQKGELNARKVENAYKRQIWLITANEQELQRLIALRQRPKQWIYNSRIQRVD